MHRANNRGKKAKICPPEIHDELLMMYQEFEEDIRDLVDIFGDNMDYDPPPPNGRMWWRVNEQQNRRRNHLSFINELRNTPYRDNLIEDTHREDESDYLPWLSLND